MTFSRIWRAKKVPNGPITPDRKTKPLLASSDPFLHRYFVFHKLHFCTAEEFLAETSKPDFHLDFHIQLSLLKSLGQDDTLQGRDTHRYNARKLLDSVAVEYRSSCWWATFICPVTCRKQYKLLGQHPSGFETPAELAQRVAFEEVRLRFRTTTTMAAVPNATTLADLYLNERESSLAASGSRSGNWPASINNSDSVESASRFGSMTRVGSMLKSLTW